MTGVLLSVKPKYVREILNGNKRYEFRRQIFRDRSRDVVLIYASSPIKKIVAYFPLGEIVKGHPDHLWEQFKGVSGVSKEEFFNYFSGKEYGFAIRIEEVEQFAEPLDPAVLFEKFVPPQSFCYVDCGEIQNKMINNRVPTGKVADTQSRLPSGS